MPINQIFNAYSSAEARTGTVGVSKVVRTFHFFKRYSERNNCQYSLLISPRKQLIELSNRVDPR